MQSIIISVNKVINIKFNVNLHITDVIMEAKLYSPILMITYLIFYYIWSFKKVVNCKNYQLKEIEFESQTY